MEQEDANSRKQAIEELKHDTHEMAEDTEYETDSLAVFMKTVTVHSPIKHKAEVNASVKVQPATNDRIGYNEDDIYYRMNDGREKLAIIFNHYAFNPKVGEMPALRKGTEIDCERLTKCLTEKLGFFTTVYENPELFTIRAAIEEVSGKSASDVSCIVVVAMTHGKANGVLRADDCLYPKSFLLDSFLDEETKLVGVPKLFFIQACRGTRMDEGRLEVDGFSNHRDYFNKLPTHADILTMFSTQEGYASVRQAKGSWFIQALCEQLEKVPCRWDLLQQLTLVNGNMAMNHESWSRNIDKHGKKQMPQIESTLTKLLKFS